MGRGERVGEVRPEPPLWVRCLPICKNSNAMKRSAVNSLIGEAIRFLDSSGFKLPEWGYWTREEWLKNRDRIGRVRELKLGWDITDFGSGDFPHKGLVLFTIRNGILNSAKYGKDYAEKIMIVRRDHLTPLHFHFHKMEDIIVRSGGRLTVKLWKSDAQEGLSKDRFSVLIDEFRHDLGPGDEITINPGQSINLEPRVYHEFRTPDVMVLLGEVSRVNDDEKDNRFFEPISRFSKIEEDEPAKYYLCGEYPR